MIVFKDIKKNSKYSLKKNYALTVIMCIIGLLFLSLYGLTNRAILIGVECTQNFFDNGHFMTDATINYIASDLYKQANDFDSLFDLSNDELTNQGYNQAAINFIRSLDPYSSNKTSLVQRLKVKDGFVKPILSFVSSDFKIIFQNIEDIFASIILGNFVSGIGLKAFIAILFMVVSRLTLFNVLTVGYCRFFLENSKYHKTRIGRIIYPFRTNYLKVFCAMARKTLYQFLWNFTIIGGIIKLYSYKLVPYIIAEDNNISSKEAIDLSKNLMNGYKFKAFLFDLSFLGWRLISVLFFGITGVFFVNPYIEGSRAEFYKAMIKERKGEDFYKAYLNERNYVDEALYVEEDGTYYPGSEPTDNDYAMQDYKPITLIALFFVFAFVGWCLEVVMFLYKTHDFVNRGTLLGPWLPIYGVGCVAILVLYTKTVLKKFLKEPLLLFFNIMVLCGLLEFFTSLLLEMTTGLKYWDYKGHLLSIDGRVCLENIFEFGVGGLLCVYLFAPKLNTIIEKVDRKKLAICLSVLVMLFITDLVYTKFHPRVGYGITDSIIDDEGNVIDKNGNIISMQIQNNEIFGNYI